MKQRISSTLAFYFTGRRIYASFSYCKNKAHFHNTFKHSKVFIERKFIG